MSEIALDHASLMDRVYRQQRHIYDLTRAWYLLGRDHMLAEIPVASGDRILEVGCGTGRNLVTAVGMHPLGRFFGIDISSEMLISTRKALAKAGMAGRVTVAQGDATCFDPVHVSGQLAFERIFFSYTLSMIPQWQTALSQALTCLAPGGSLHIVDFGQQERLPRIFRTLLFKWLDMFHVSPRKNLRDVLETLAREHNASVSFVPLYRGYAWSAILRLN